jgi:hypothetical protein
MILSIQECDSQFSHLGFDFFLYGNNVVLESVFDPPDLSDEEQFQFGIEAMSGEVLWGSFIHWTTPPRKTQP